MKEDESEMGGESTPVVTLYSRQPGAPGSLSSLSSPQTPVSLSMSCTVEDVLHLLRHLYVIMTYHDDIICNVVDGKFLSFTAPAGSQMGLVGLAAAM